MLDFNILLQNAPIDLASTLVVRHVPVEKRLKTVLPWLVEERPDLWLTYQQIQWESLEKAMTKAGFIASFVGQEGGEATFAGLYRIGSFQKLDLEGYRSFPGNKELEALGMSGRDNGMGECLAFELETMTHYSDWISKLTIEWPMPFQQWWRWAGRNNFAIRSIEIESRFVREMPGWQDIVLTWHELHALPASWKAALAEWRGIYFVYDAARRAGYVGSAYGPQNLLGRWSDYASNGHGGNNELKTSDPADLTFSILQRTSPDLEPVEVIALEGSWKERLHTREFGLNRN